MRRLELQGGWVVEVRRTWVGYLSWLSDICRWYGLEGSVLRRRGDIIYALNPMWYWRQQICSHSC